MSYEVTKGQTFKHYKGSIYTVTGMATHTETCEGLVIYQDSNNNVWARPVEMFFGYLDDGTRRFTPIEENEDDLDEDYYDEREEMDMRVNFEY